MLLSGTQSIANTIYKYYGIKVDPSKHTWEELSELYQRLCTAESIEKYHGVDADWKTKTASELREMYHNLNKESWSVD
jgi:hypothetical protein